MTDEIEDPEFEKELRELRAKYREENKRVGEFNRNRMDDLMKIINELDIQKNKFQAQGRGCACDPTGTCAAHAGAFNAINECMVKLTLAFRDLQHNNQELRR